MKFSKMSKIGLGLFALLFVSQVQAIALTSYSLNTNSDPDADASWFEVDIQGDVHAWRGSGRGCRRQWWCWGLEPWIRMYMHMF